MNPDRWKNTEKLLNQENLSLDRKMWYEKTKKWLYPTMVASVLVVGIGMAIYEKKKKTRANSIMKFSDVSLPSIAELSDQIQIQNFDFIGKRHSRSNSV